MSTAAPAPVTSKDFKRMFWSGVVRILANILMVGAVFFAMYQSSLQPGSALLHFSIWFFGITVPLWIGAAFLLRKIRQWYPCEHTTFMTLPGHRPALVRWRVREQSENIFSRTTGA